MCGQRRVDPVDFFDWRDALDFDNPVAVINAIRQR